MRCARRPDSAFSTAGVAAKAGRVFGLERRLAHRLLHAIGRPPVRLRCCGTAQQIAESDAAPVARILFRDRATFWKVLWDPDLQFGDAYSDGRLEVEGDLVALLEAISRSQRNAGRCRQPACPHLCVAGCTARGPTRFPAPARTSTTTTTSATTSTNCGSTDEMVYSGAYFPVPTMSLEDAQRAKLDYVCRKLWLKPGETLVEVGGGWGALALLAARNYGVTVKSFNISKPQLVYARQRAKAEGLDAQVEFIEDDYRNITGRFDALVSLGMLEHVGARHYREFGRMIDRCLSPTGRGLIQVIGQDQPGEINPWIERRIFPGTYPAHAAGTDRPVRAVRFSDSRRREPAAALRQDAAALARRFEAAAAAVARMFDDRFVRAWRLYLAGSCAAFGTGALELYQMLFTRPGTNNIPWNRQRLYLDGGSMPKSRIESRLANL